MLAISRSKPLVVGGVALGAAARVRRIVGRAHARRAAQRRDADTGPVICQRG